MSKVGEGGEGSISFLCSRVRLIDWMMTCVERMRRRRGSDLFPVYNMVDTLHDNMCRKNEKEEEFRYLSIVVEYG